MPARADTRLEEATRREDALAGDGQTTGEADKNRWDVTA